MSLKRIGMLSFDRLPCSCPEEAGCPGVRSWHLCWGHVGLIGLDELDCRRSWKLSYILLYVYNVVYGMYGFHSAPTTKSHGHLKSRENGHGSLKGPLYCFWWPQALLGPLVAFSLGLTLFSFQMCLCRNSLEKSLTRVARKLTLMTAF